MADETPDPAKLGSQNPKALERGRAIGPDKDARLAAALRSNLARRKAAARTLPKPEGET